jgi:hypothetical protein
MGDSQKDYAKCEMPDTKDYILSEFHLHDNLT